MVKKNYLYWVKLAIVLEGALLLVLMVAWHFDKSEENYLYTSGAVDKQQKITWVDFNVSYEALCLAYEWDVKTYEEEVHLNWIELLAYLGTRYGGDFDSYSKSLKKDMNGLAEKLTSKEATIEELTKEMKYYSYYLEA